ncbi:MAG: DUF4340 domain-containing protein, partial [Treponema sp.]|nr:DUF4340 domain-containing protein [Treponema sp.]
EIYGINANIILERKNNIWVMGAASSYYPVKQYRVEELLDSLTRKRNYPVRSSSVDPAVLGLGDGALRITIRGGAGLPLLDLLIGSIDVSGKEVYLRKAGNKEIRSGPDVFTIYTNSTPQFWYDLRLFPELTPDMVQRVHLSMLSTPNSPLPSENQLTIVRRNNGWIIENLDMPFPNGESWVRSIIEAQAENFTSSQSTETYASITLELGTGAIRILNIGSPIADNSRIATVSGSAYSYSLSEWTVNRLCRDVTFFK